MSSQLDRIEWKLDMLLAMLRGGSEGMVAVGRSSPPPPQSREEVADRFGVSVNTAKVYLRSLAKRLGVTLRTQIAVKVLPVLRALSDEEYRALARGLPKDWDENYGFARREDDPYWASYTGSRVKGEDDLDLDEETGE
jgi:hypothetical protein